MTPTPAAEAYRGASVLVTGGLGFIGSTLARALADAGASVVVMDALIPEFGGLAFNLAGYESRIRVVHADLRDASAIATLVAGQTVIFNLAGQVSHIDSMRDPLLDLGVNAVAHVTLLEACRAHNPAARIVYAGTRQIYGRPDRLPVNEDHPIRPTDINGVNKAAGEQYHLVYSRALGLRACSLRLTNIYGPRQLIRHNRQGFIGWFIRTAIEDGTIQIYGDGSQLRDFVHVDDAVDAFLRAGLSDACIGQALNVGGAAPIAHCDLSALIVELAGSGRVTHIPWPAEKQAIDIGNFYTDSTRFHAATGWTPRIPLREGLASTIAFYREHFAAYVPEGSRRGTP